VHDSEPSDEKYKCGSEPDLLVDVETQWTRKDLSQQPVSWDNTEVFYLDSRVVDPEVAHEVRVEKAE